MKRKKEKARNSKQTKAAMREAQGREDDIATEDTSKHSELQPSPLPAALDMRIDMSTSSARESVLILPDRLPAQGKSEAAMRGARGSARPVRFRV